MIHAEEQIGAVETMSVDVGKLEIFVIGTVLSCDLWSTTVFIAFWRIVDDICCWMIYSYVS